ncbi:hypothetical protein LK459_14535 [Gordonia otitidis]|uniref:hypothetical protein n=1 Tax=Gordonia otitidis TaxID=249058 RepID=UPI001D15661C|nr:hypothetical protein [Gordonia otitidis]UEA57822.1 hypothetical protein LK459_14535 [Gordonia otitidis]
MPESCRGDAPLNPTTADTSLSWLDWKPGDALKNVADVTDADTLPSPAPTPNPASPTDPQPYGTPPPYGAVVLPGGRSSNAPWLAALAAIVVLALVGGVAIWAVSNGKFSGITSSTSAAGGNGNSANIPDTLTRCSQPINVTDIRTALNPAGLAVTMTLSSPCSDGDVLSGSEANVTISSSAGTVAGGNLDLSGAPIGIPPQPNSRQVTITYPTGSYYQLPDVFSGSDLKVQITDSDPASVSGLSSSQTSAATSATVSQATLPSNESADSLAAQSLNAQMAVDRGQVLANSNNQWVAQLSSKQPGLVADGKTWTNKDILDEFTANYQRFSGARLLWSNDWSVFSSPGWWVTITAQTFPTGQAAVNWCVQQNFDRDHCLGKLISNTAPPEGSTVYIR